MKNHNSTFQERVYAELARIPKGRITTYKRLAKLAGRPNAFRAVGRAMATNEEYNRVPCFKVIFEDGRVGNYNRKGVSKEVLLEKEGARILNGRVANFAEIIYPKEV